LMRAGIGRNLRLVFTRPFSPLAWVCANVATVGALLCGWIIIHLGLVSVAGYAWGASLSPAMPLYTLQWILEKIMQSALYMLLALNAGPWAALVMFVFAGDSEMLSSFKEIKMLSLDLSGVWGMLAGGLAMLLSVLYFLFPGVGHFNELLSNGDGLVNLWNGTPGTHAMAIGYYALWIALLLLLCERRLLSLLRRPDKLG
ncbi:MAG: hypothetical protein PHQ23_11870, partial [Candidatus Wallbacteria bacterium]|nr:hypothetical protein [Candidatus Wallbacteria bacterium]